MAYGPCLNCGKVRKLIRSERQTPNRKDPFIHVYCSLNCERINRARTPDDKKRKGPARDGI